VRTDKKTHMIRWAQTQRHIRKAHDTHMTRHMMNIKHTEVEDRAGVVVGTFVMEPRHHPVLLSG
jgi:hypothetical protein